MSGKYHSEIKNTVRVVTRGEKKNHYLRYGQFEVSMEHPRKLIHSSWVYGYDGWVEVWFGDAMYHLLTC